MQVHYILKSVVMLQILEKLYHPKHITIAHELIKLVSILLSLGDGASAAATFTRAEAIFSLYYGSHMEKILAYLGTLKRAVHCESTGACCQSTVGNDPHGSAE